MKFIAKSETYREILKLALPVIAGLSTQMILSLVDTAMVGRIEDAQYALAAMGLGVLATWALTSFFSSLATGTHVLVAHNYGRNDFPECGRILNTSLYISIFIGIIVGLAGVYFSHSISQFFAADVKVGSYAGDYLYYRFMGIPFFLISVSYRGFYFGINRTKIFMYSGILANILNIFFNYVLIYGEFGFEPMGLAGAGLGSTLATICDVLYYLIVAMSSSLRKKYLYFKFTKWNKSIARSIVKISLPVSFHNIFLLIGFLSFIAVTGLIGTLEQAASQIVMSSLFISFMPCFGFGAAVQTLTGNNLGRGKIAIAKFYAFETSKLATFYTVLIGIIFICFPKIILYLVTNDAEIIETALPAIRIAGFGQIFYAVGVVLANGLQAAGKSLYVMLSEIIINWFLFIPLAYLLGVYLNFGLTGAWSALPLYVVLYSLSIFIKFKFGKWGKEF
ncbi:MAG: MATE family efflux transporter [Ignavibacteria bacterium]|nr:MATE family efflux transporter [Ignavibacteria bacterium]